ncbi:MAG: type II toxin-antitoxin system RelB/DinJ family antitoxin [bacterium]
MRRSAMIRARTDPDLKSRVEEIFEKLGLTTTEAINLFFRQIAIRRGLPFDVVLPASTTRKTFRDTDSGKNLVHCHDADEMFNKLGL